MGQVVQTSGDYRIKTQETGTITLDTGPGVGEVRVTGNLVVDGDTLTVSAENLQVQDNIITVNYGETGAGVTLRYAGIEVDRGTEADVSLLWDENTLSWNLLRSGTGPYENSTLVLKELLSNSDTENGDLFLLGNASGLVKLKDTVNYEQLVIDRDDPDAIPNKKYVDDAIQLSPTFQIVRDNTRVTAFDYEDPLALDFFPIGNYYSQPNESLVAVIVDNDTQAVFTKNSIRLGNLILFEEQPSELDPGLPSTQVIQTFNTDANIKLETNGTGKVEITYALQFDDPGGVVLAVDGASLLYRGEVGSGLTGLYSLNTTKRDELVTKGRALLYSMIF